MWTILLLMLLLWAIGSLSGYAGSLVNLLLVGAITVGIGVLLVGTATRGLFEVMVTLFGLFVGPMLIPMLAGLLIRRITWRGAAAGIGAGFTTGFGLFLSIRTGCDTISRRSASWRTSARPSPAWRS